MAMSPGNQAITGGTVLRAPAIQSPDYVPGVSGWIIRIDGTTEFNNGTFRGSIEVGPVTGQHFIVNNPATGDVIDVYDSNNDLVMYVDRFGAIGTINPPVQHEIYLTGNGIHWDTRTNPSYNLPSVSGQGDATDGNLISIDTGEAVTGNGNASLDLYDATASFTGKSYIAAIQGSTTSTQGPQGLVVQTDTSFKNNLQHSDVYTATVSGSTGMATFAHNCDFTPKGGVIGPLTHFSQWNWSSAHGVNGFTATDAQLTMFVPAGAVVNNGVACTFHAMLWG